MFGWTYVDAAGDEMGKSRHFPDAESAEEWMRACWADLVGCGSRRWSCTTTPAAYGCIGWGSAPSGQSECRIGRREGREPGI